MARIAIDVDGVLADFIKAFNAVVNKIWPGKLDPNYQPVGWDWAGILTKKEVSKAWSVIRGTENFWLGLDACSDNMGELATWMVVETNHDIWLCTSRSASKGLTAAKQTDIWIQSCGLRAVNNFLGIVTIPHHGNKSQFYEAAEIEWSLDDKPETVIDCGLIDSFEHKAWLLNRPWNASASVHNRVGSMAEFLRKIK